MHLLYIYMTAQMFIYIYIYTHTHTHTYIYSNTHAIKKHSKLPRLLSNFSFLFLATKHLMIRKSSSSQIYKTIPICF